MGGGVSLARIADVLSGDFLDRHVVDETGTKDAFNIHLEFALDETIHCVGPASLCAVDTTTDIPAAPSIFTALEQQLGLKLESIKGQRGFLMIDHLERPSEN
jgi:uncharacterized protein (TIGR03435 family)